MPLISRDDHLPRLLVASGIGGAQDVDAFLGEPVGMTVGRREFTAAEVIHGVNLLRAFAGVVEGRNDAFNIRVDDLPVSGGKSEHHIGTVEGAAAPYPVILEMAGTNLIIVVRRTVDAIHRHGR